MITGRFFNYVKQQLSIKEFKCRREKRCTKMLLKIIKFKYDLEQQIYKLCKK